MRITTLLAHLVLAGLAVLLAACAVVPAGEGAPGQPGAAPPPEPEPVTAGMAVDFRSRTVTSALPDGWTVAFCEGEGPFLCVDRAGEFAGALELGSFAVEDGFDPRAHAEDFIATFTLDRGQTCADHVLTPNPVEPVPFGQVEGISFGFRLAGPDGAVTEAVWVALAVEDGTAHFLTAKAYDHAGCPGTEEGAFSIADGEAFAPWLTTLYAGTRLPAPETQPTPAPGGEPADRGLLPDGAHTVRVASLDSAGWLEVDPVRFLTGDEARAAAREAGFIQPGEDLPNDFWIDDPDDVVFALRLASDAAITVYDCAQSCESTGVSLGDLASGAARPLNGRSAVYAIVLRDGLVVSLDEIYMP
jgi:hypothetical protein